MGAAPVRATRKYEDMGAKDKDRTGKGKSSWKKKKQDSRERREVLHQQDVRPYL